MVWRRSAAAAPASRHAAAGPPAAAAAAPTTTAAAGGGSREPRPAAGSLPPPELDPHALELSWSVASLLTTLVVLPLPSRAPRSWSLSPPITDNFHILCPVSPHPGRWCASMPTTAAQGVSSALTAAAAAAAVPAVTMPGHSSPASAGIAPRSAITMMMTSRTALQRLATGRYGEMA